MKKTIVLLLCLALTLSSLCVFPVSAATEAWDGETASTSLSGSGTEDDPYLIQNGADLDFMRKKINAGEANGEGTYYSACHYLQTADIVITSSENADEWLHLDPIGPTNTSTKYLSGTYDGGNHTISKFKITSTDKYIGLFGYVTGTVKNLNVAKANVNSRSTTSSSAVGAIVGYINSGATVSNCTTASDCKVESTNVARVGGVVGWNYTSTVTNCINYATVTYNGESQAYVGGVLSTNGKTAAKVEYCVNFGTVNVIQKGANLVYAGGIAGLAGGSSSTTTGGIMNCVNFGSVTCTSTTATAVVIGGIAGNNNGAKDRLIDCYTVLASGCALSGTAKEGVTPSIGLVLGAGKDTGSANCYGVKTQTVLGAYGAGTLESMTAVDNCAATITKSDGTETTLGAAVYAIYAKVCNGPERELALSQDLSVIYHLTVDDQFIGTGNTLAVEFAMKTSGGNDASVTVAPSATDASKYSFRFAHLTPQVIGEAITVTLKVVDAEGNDFYTLYTFDDTIKAYLMQLVKATSSSAQLKTLASSLLVYGQELHEYLGATCVKVLDGTEEGLTPSEAEVTAADMTKTESTGVSKFTGAGVRIANTNKMYFTFTPDTTKDVTVKINGVDAEATDLGNGTWIVYSDGIAAHEHSSYVSAELFEAGVSVQTLSLSICNYANAMKNDATVGDVVTALYRYGAAAYAYKNS